MCPVVTSVKIPVVIENCRYETKHDTVIISACGLQQRAQLLAKTNAHIIIKYQP